MYWTLAVTAWETHPVKAVVLPLPTALTTLGAVAWLGMRGWAMVARQRSPTLPGLVHTRRVPAAVAFTSKMAPSPDASMEAGLSTAAWADNGTSRPTNSAQNRNHVLFNVIAFVMIISSG
jgi:hypothetical protein